MKLCTKLRNKRLRVLLPNDFMKSKSFRVVVEAKEEVSFQQNLDLFWIKRLRFKNWG